MAQRSGEIKMPAKWIKETEPEDIETGKIYFIAIRPATSMMKHLFAATDINGKFIWSEKPGIANRYKGSKELKKHLMEKPDLIAVIEPPDASKRWKARKPK